MISLADWIQYTSAKYGETDRQTDRQMASAALIRYIASCDKTRMLATANRSCATRRVTIFLDRPGCGRSCKHFPLM